MDSRKIEELERKYRPMIETMIQENKKFFAYMQDLSWKFFYNENKALFANFNPVEKCIGININAMDYCCSNNQCLYVEYNVLHEMWHLYQDFNIFLYEKGLKPFINTDILETYIRERGDYQSPIYENGIRNEKYYYQSYELDAYAFSYAAITYKYGKIEYIDKIPDICRLDLRLSKFLCKRIEEFSLMFKEQGLL